MKKITVAVVSYNTIPPYKKGVVRIKNKKVLILSNTFNPKCPDNVRSDDPNWQKLLFHKNDLQKVIIFAGKKESGALEIIDRALADFKKRKRILFFVLCDHDLEEKIDKLKQYGISKTQYVCFSDGHERCYETPFLLGFMHDYLDNN
ncbi:hypothetical protein A2645_00965 [Candidatus Nomurabacteria bacterium RIFCSPHIGHO2_01_FULL_39_9]|uniref:Uncharacterized protein n=1 Tax=Candidatus Nomurabacteria bacterium RIFCSPHIGHO2_01_FULL_39_9 TaxID=1801735 RepID=A0A1F6UWU7_9BACT|nr:MAG: hypothetical protein A2645_00965 [Candidatus Nomurabacteria bacterium RIFCSPHIGHO2_01_FULL_39_9]